RGMGRRGIFRGRIEAQRTAARTPIPAPCTLIDPHPCSPSLPGGRAGRMPKKQNKTGPYLNRRANRRERNGPVQGAFECDLTSHQVRAEARGAFSRRLVVRPEYAGASRRCQDGLENFLTDRASGPLCCVWNLLGFWAS